MIGTCGADGCIGTVVALAIFVTSMAMWAIGFGVGKGVAWTRALRSAA